MLFEQYKQKFINGIIIKFNYNFILKRIEEKKYISHVNQLPISNINE